MAAQASAAPPTLPPDEDLGTRVESIVWTLVALSAIVLSLRVWCKWLRHRGLWWDDHLLVIAWVRPNCRLILLSSARPSTSNKPPFLISFYSLPAPAWAPTTAVSASATT